jgi:hypothetical protein
MFMMTTTGKLLALEIIRNGAPIAVLEQLGRFTVSGQSYRVRPIGTSGDGYELRRGDEILASAKAMNSNWFVRYSVTYGDKSWLLKGEGLGFFGRVGYGLYEGATRLGGIAPGGWFVAWNGATIDMPDALPLDAQLFLTSVVMSKWSEGDSAS